MKLSNDYDTNNMIHIWPCVLTLAVIVMIVIDVLSIQVRLSDSVKFLRRDKEDKKLSIQPTYACFELACFFEDNV